MKLKLKRDDLLIPVQQVIGAVEKRQTLPALSNILIRAGDNELALTATDLEIELVSRNQVMVDEPGEITLPAKKLFDICKSLPADADIQLEVDDNRALVKSGRNRFTLSTLPATDFPSLDAVSSVYEFSVSQSILKKLIDKTGFAMAQQDVRYYLNGLMMEVSSGIIRAVATDGHRLAYCENPIDTDVADSKQVIVPRKGVVELQRLIDDVDEPVKIILGSNHIQCEFGQQRFTSKLIDGRFPDYKRVLPEAEGNLLVVDKDAFKQALLRASILSNEKYRGIRIVMESKLIKLEAHNPDQEEANIELGVDYQGDQMEVGFNVNYMLDVLNSSDDDMVQCYIRDANSSCLMIFPEHPESRYVIMPMRL